MWPLDSTLRKISEFMCTYRKIKNKPLRSFTFRVTPICCITSGAVEEVIGNSRTWGLPVRALTKGTQGNSNLIRSFHYQLMSRLMFLQSRCIPDLGSKTIWPVSAAKYWLTERFSFTVASRTATRLFLVAPIFQQRWYIWNNQVYMTWSSWIQKVTTVSWL